jgi:hypothetical protein
MIWTDQPYDVDYAAKNAHLNRSDRGNRIRVPIENDKLTAGETGFLFKAALSVAKDWAQAGATVYATVPSGPLLVHFVQALTAAGFTFRAQLAWVKQQFVIGMADYHHRFEPILYGWLPDGAHYSIEDRRQAWRVAQGLLLPFSPPPSTKAGQLQSTTLGGGCSECSFVTKLFQLRTRRNVLQ